MGFKSCFPEKISPWSSTLKQDHHVQAQLALEPSCPHPPLLLFLANLLLLSRINPKGTGAQSREL